jgi:hypothetical protein
MDPFRVPITPARGGTYDVKIVAIDANGNKVDRYVLLRVNRAA